MSPRPGESLNDAEASIKSATAVDLSSTDFQSQRITRGIYVGVAGNVVVQFCDDVDSNTITLSNLAAGVWHPMQVQRIVKVGTTATGIVAGF